MNSIELLDILIELFSTRATESKSKGVEAIKRGDSSDYGIYHMLSREYTQMVGCLQLYKDKTQNT